MQRANIQSGNAPLTSYFSVSTSIPNSVVTYDFDYEGDAIDDYTGTTFDDISVEFSAEGIYYPTITVTDNQSITYTDSIAIIVLNQTNLDALLQAKWSAMKTALGNQDVNGALVYFSGETSQLYSDMFTALYDQLPQIVQDMQTIELIYTRNKAAKHRIRKDEIYGGQSKTFTYYIYFEVDSDGIWKIINF